MNLEKIYESIARAKQHEAATHHLEELVNKHLPVLEPLIEVPNDKPAAALVEFVIDYIDYVPSLLDAVAIGAKKAGIESHVKPLLNIAIAYFVSPPETVPQQGLMALMDEAYLAHRFIEEVNDIYVANAGMPLIPMDTTMANVIIHNLIGEPFANELDAIVHQAVKQMITHTAVYRANHFEMHVDGRKETGKQWPCFTKNTDITVGINKKASSVSKESAVKNL